jgi:hypothetical protein
MVKSSADPSLLCETIKWGKPIPKPKPKLIAEQKGELSLILIFF